MRQLHESSRTKKRLSHHNMHRSPARDLSTVRLLAYDNDDGDEEKA